MSDVIFLIILAINILAISDVLAKLRAPVPRALWIICILALPGIGVAFWAYVQYVAPKQKLLDRKRRGRKLTK